jgi:hypothetical protein
MGISLLCTFHVVPDNEAERYRRILAINELRVRAGTEHALHKRGFAEKPWGSSSDEAIESQAEDSLRKGTNESSKEYL